MFKLTKSLKKIFNDYSSNIAGHSKIVNEYISSANQNESETVSIDFKDIISKTWVDIQKRFDEKRDLQKYSANNSELNEKDRRQISNFLSFFMNNINKNLKISYGQGEKEENVFMNKLLVLYEAELDDDTKKNLFKFYSKALKQFICIIKLDDDELLKSIDSFFTNKMKEVNRGRSEEEINGTCPVCYNNAGLLAPSFLTNYGDKKTFSKHIQRPQKENLKICENCRNKINQFSNILTRKKIKIFPLFLDETTQKKEIRLINENGYNSFHFIFQQLKEDVGNKDFYLVYLAKGVLLFDYISNYEWFVKDQQIDYFKSKKWFIFQDEAISKKFSSNKKDIEKEISLLLGKTEKENIGYFSDKLEGGDTFLIYKYRNKISRSTF